MSVLTCITFRAADDKGPGDVSRNWDQIEAIIPKEDTQCVMLDPHDSSVYMIGLNAGLEPQQEDFLLTLLHLVVDERDNRPLLADAACRAVHIEHFRGHEAGRADAVLSPPPSPA